MRAQPISGRRGRRYRQAFLGLSVLLIAVTLAACGSSKKSTTATTAAASSATTAAASTATTAAASTATTAAAGASTSGLAAAQAFVAKASVRPTAITDTAKVTGTIPKGKTIYFIPCGPNPECQQEGQIVKQADTILGWNTVIAPNDGSPQGSQGGVRPGGPGQGRRRALHRHPPATFQSEIPALKANKTVVSTCCVTDPVGNGIDYAIDVPSQVGPVGGAQAAFVASDSKCKNANSVVVNIPDLPILGTGVDGLQVRHGRLLPRASVAVLTWPWLTSATPTRRSCRTCEPTRMSSTWWPPPMALRSGFPARSRRPA